MNIKAKKHAAYKYKRRNCETNCTYSRGVLRIQSNIYDGAFVRKKVNGSKSLIIFDIVDIRLGSNCASPFGKMSTHHKRLRYPLFQNNKMLLLLIIYL